MLPKRHPICVYLIQKSIEIAFRENFFPMDSMRNSKINDIHRIEFTLWLFFFAEQNKKKKSSENPIV